MRSGHGRVLLSLCLQPITAASDLSGQCQPATVTGPG